jgi:phage terminase small subunit
VTSKQRRFVDEYLVDLNASKAAERAGFSAKTAYSIGQRLLKNVEIRQAVDEAIEARSVRTGLTQDWVLERLKENVDRSMQAEAVKDKFGNETGEYIYNGGVANGALTLIGKHLGMFVEKSEVDLKATVSEVKVTKQVVDPSAP